MATWSPSPARAVIGLLLLTATLAGCGSSSSGNGVAAKSPAAILAAAKLAADDATSVHVAGSIVTAKAPITFDMELLTGKGARGTLSESGASFELIQIGGTVYLKGSAAFYRRIGGSEAAKLLEGKWLKAPASSSSLAALSSLINLDELIDSVLANHSTLAKGATSTVAGERVIALTDTANGGTLYVATSGQPYPIEITKAGTDGGKIVFDDWDQAVTLTAPEDAIDITQLGAGR